MNAADAGEHGEELARGVVRPVQVLDHQQQRTPAGETPENTNGELAKLLAGQGWASEGSLLQSLYETRKRRADASEHLVEAGCVEVIDESGEDLSQWRHWPDQLAVIHTPPEAHVEPSRSRPFRQLTDQSGLAHAGFTGEEDDA